ncbi:MULTISPECIES: XdhC family protein [Catenuloplanes]|uniref:Xanthine dehydrogenase accessory factor n=1 Tax=Catenuloplanes niger TaxID=587534 RepID=A0AAE4CX73_9ACTN|nr:XdhC family protein [Catenuloplanes niger]MDR7327177.1 xanthine dehydrogenase accessory factor [Catenuloplanes niger]
MLTEVWPFVIRARRAGRPVVLARLVGRDGPGSRPLGATMAVAGDGSWCGSVSGGCVEGILLDTAREVLDGGGPRLVSVSPGEQLLPWEPAPACAGVLTVLVTPAPPAAVCDEITSAIEAARPIAVGVSLTAPWSWATAPSIDLLPTSAAGVPGAGRATAGAVFAEEVRPGPRLIVAGATDLAAALAALGRTTGRRVEIVDPRPSHARDDMFPGASLVVRAWPDEWLAAHPPSAADAVVAITHDPRIDDRALRAALAGPAGYVGALGSRATHAQRLDRLSGAPGLDRLRGPAGLDLGATSIAETALSVLAEVVAAAHDRTGGPLTTSTAPIQAVRAPAPTPSAPPSPAPAAAGGPASGSVAPAEPVPVTCAL